VLVKDEGLELEDLIGLLTSNPRAIMGFDSDLFSEGTEAEITILDPDVEWTFEKEHVQSRSINSPYYGESLSGKVEYTISRGYIASKSS
jgi:dihydroorotase